MQHLHANFRSVRFKGKKFKDAHLKYAWAIALHNFQAAMQEIQQFDEKAL